MVVIGPHRVSEPLGRSYLTAVVAGHSQSQNQLGPGQLIERAKWKTKRTPSLAGWLAGCESAGRVQ